MRYTTLISTTDLTTHLNESDWAVVDCRFSLGDVGRGRRAYRRSHIPRAVYADLNEDLSGPIVPGRTGRHPLPNIETFADKLSKWGIGPGVQVVAYDDSGGCIAARLWWLLRWLGHDPVAVLDGGWLLWREEGRPTSQDPAPRQPRRFIPDLRGTMLASAADVEASLQDPGCRLIDCRSGERYRGESEPIDPVAGHIPGAVSAPFADNIGPEGLFLPPDVLRSRFRAVLDKTPPKDAIFYCGSGVTATHNLLALAHAGLGEARLYAGSWSEWITNPRHPIETG